MNPINFRIQLGILHALSRILLLEIGNFLLQAVESASALRPIFIDEGIVKVDKAPQEFFANPENERLKAFLSKVL